MSIFYKKTPSDSQLRLKTILPLVAISLLSAQATSCGFSGTRPKPKSQAGLMTPTKPAKNATAVPKVIGPVEKQSPQLLSRSVARVLGFADVAGKTLTVYQDSYSALYQSIKKKNAEVGEQPPPTVIFFSPLFVLGNAEAILENNGNFRIVMYNKYNTEAIRNSVFESLSKVLKPMGVDKERIGLLSFDSISGTVRAFAKEYAAAVDKDLARIVISMPSKDVPASLKTSKNELLKEGNSLRVIKFFDALDFKYAYYVQKVDETSCRFDFDQDYINKMYIDSTCQDPALKIPPPAEVEQIEKSNAKWQGLAEILKKISNPITTCLAGTESARALQRASISCTRPLQSSDGTRSQINDALAEFAKKTYNTPIENAELTPDTQSWNVSSAAAAVAMFGSPERFASELNKFNNDVLNQDSLDTGSTKLTESSDFLKTLDTHRAINSTENSSSNSRSFGGGFSFLISLGVKSSGSSSSMTKSLSDIFDQALKVTKTDRADYLKQTFKSFQLNHDITNAEGKLKFFPRVTFNVKANVDKITEAAQKLQTAELGNIVTENDSFSADFRTYQESFLRGTIECGAVPKVFSKSVQEIDWWTSETFFDSLSNEINKKIPAEGCSAVRLTVWLETDGRNGIAPNVKTIRLNFEASTKVEGNSSKSKPFEIPSKATEQNPAISDSLFFSDGVPVNSINLSF